MSQDRDTLEALAQKVMAGLGEWAKLDGEFGKDEYEDGTVLRFSKVFEAFGDQYRYAALKANSRWYLTSGRREISPMSWDRLMKFMDGSGVEVATEWKDING